MNTYRVYFTNTVSGWVNVEAEDKDEAVELAYERIGDNNYLCNYCGNFMEIDGEWELDDSEYGVERVSGEDEED